MQTKGYRVARPRDLELFIGMEQKLLSVPEKEIEQFYYSGTAVKSLLSSLDDSGLRYLILENINEELPNRLLIHKPLVLLSHPESWNLFPTNLEKLGFVQMLHPYGSKNGWKYLYSAQEPYLFYHPQSGLLVNLYNQLLTKSVGMNAWLPLDKAVQESIWNQQPKKAKNGLTCLDDENYVIYLTTTAVFVLCGFTKDYIAELDLRKTVLRSKTCQQKFALIFFKFTPRLMELLQKGKYDSIVSEYLHFTDY